MEAGGSGPERAGERPAPTSYLLIGPPDLLHDLWLDFEEVGWAVSVMRWQAVVTAPPEDAGAPQPGWPAEVTLARVTRDDHETACRDFFVAG
ncbi:MAG TPA: hypothetical protein VKD47_02145 [Miltoncostaeaceae bacterium]|nr:hypothetical protein [Miltoncostaeaceae bacterium]